MTKINDKGLLACEKRGEKLKYGSGRGKSFGNADVIFRLAILRGGRRNAKKNADIGGMQVIVLLSRNYHSGIGTMFHYVTLARYSTRLHTDRTDPGVIILPHWSSHAGLGIQIKF